MLNFICYPRVSGTVRRWYRLLVLTPLAGIRSFIGPDTAPVEEGGKNERGGIPAAAKQCCLHMQAHSHTHTHGEAAQLEVGSLAVSVSWPSVRDTRVMLSEDFFFSVPLPLPWGWAPSSSSTNPWCCRGSCTVQRSLGPSQRHRGHNWRPSTMAA